jgi:uncharacterized protein YndB with AHSA1/START domain
MRELYVTGSVTINAAPSKVWQALVKPELTKKYMFDCEAISDWKIGSPLLWNGVVDGKEITFVKGRVVAFEPHKRMQFTVFDPNASYADIPENYTTVTYDLSERDGKTVLSVKQGDFATVADGEKRYKETAGEGGWGGVLKKLKEVIEAGF